jgi:hypothetical protein
VATGTGAANGTTVLLDPVPWSQPSLFNRVPIIRAANF